MDGSRKTIGFGLVVAATVLFGASWAGAAHLAANGWTHQHSGYPTRPSGLTAINATFGQPCNADANKVSFWRTASDNNVQYRINVHKKLAGKPVAGWTPDRGGTSTNLDHDVMYHIDNAHLQLWSGIWGYDCRYISGTTKWSTHAWGIALDIYAAYEHNHNIPGTCHPTYAHSLPNGVRDIFTQHNWKQLDCDKMHFQYADDY